jgi:hypothetical protein
MPWVSTCFLPYGQTAVEGLDAQSIPDMNHTGTRDQAGWVITDQASWGEQRRQAREPPRTVCAKIQPGDGLRRLPFGVLTGSPPLLVGQGARRLGRIAGYLSGFSGSFCAATAFQPWSRSSHRRPYKSKSDRVAGPTYRLG